MSTATKVVFIFGILLLMYGYLCRFLNIYFFWDSKYFGWLGIAFGILLLLIDIRMARIRQKQNIFFVRVFVAVIVIFLAIEGGAIIWLKTLTAYKNLKEVILMDGMMKTELGEIRGFNLIPGINIIDIIKVPSTETLNFNITVRGQRAYKELEVTIQRTSLLEWTVTSTKPL